VVTRPDRVWSAYPPEKGRAEHFTWDPAGNLHESGAGALAREYEKGNRIVRRGSTRYVWDRDGHLEAKEVLGADGKLRVYRFGWGATGTLDSIETPDGKLVEMFYDPLGRRVFKSTSTAGRPRVKLSTTRFVWDGDEVVHEIRWTSEGTSVRTYGFEDEGFAPVVHGDGAPGSAEATWVHYLTDQIGTPESLVAADGQLVAQLQRGAWHVSAPPGVTPLRFPGQYHDEETGLSYNRYRYYDPSIGLYISADPLGLEADLNFFAYVPSPLTWQDPLGLAGTMKRRRRMAEKIAEAQAKGGDQSVKGSVSRREAKRLCKQYAGDDTKRGKARNGADMLLSNDGKKRTRGASKKNSPYTRTGTQINIESGTNLTMENNAASNVHVDVKRK
jgi:RHS repeat-associated protein